MKKSEIASKVRVKLNENFKERCLGDKYLLEEPVIFIADGHIYNDQIGEYVFIKGGSMTNSTTAYLTELDLEFPIGDTPLYDWETMRFKDSWNREELRELLQSLSPNTPFSDLPEFDKNLPDAGKVTWGMMKADGITTDAINNWINKNL